MAIWRVNIGLASALAAALLLASAPALAKICKDKPALLPAVTCER
ncbi:MAG: hypothetical protein ACK4SX_04915 [Alcanivoracaceae bacterium]